METANRTSKREQILWIAVAILGLIILALLFMYLRSPKGNAPAPLPSGTLEELVATTTPSLSPTITQSPMPTLEELPYENTPSDSGMNPNEFASETPADSGGGSADATQEGTPTWYVRPFTTRTSTPVPYSGGYSGGGYVYKSPTTSNYGATSTAFWKAQTRTATFLVPTRKTATYVAGQTATFVAYSTNIARTPRPQQVAYDTGGGSDGQIFLAQVPLTDWTPTPNPSATQLALDTGQMGDWAPGGLRFVYSKVDPANGSSELNILIVNVTGAINKTPTPNPKEITIIDGINDQPTWSFNNYWIVFRHKGGSRPDGLYRVDLNGNLLQQLTNDPNDQNPDWSMDSSKIVFSNGGNIYFINVSPYPVTIITPASSNPSPTPVPTLIPNRTQLTHGNNYSWPHYSPDMRFLIMQGNNGTKNDIYMLDLTQSYLNDPKNMTADQKGNYYEPIWTRDTSKFMFLSDRDGGMNIYVMDSFRNVIPVITNGDPKSHPRLRP